MKLQSIKTDEFKAAGLSLIQRWGEILILVRYPFQAGNRDFLLLNSGQRFEEFLSERSPKDSVAIFKSVETIVEGTVTENFNDNILARLNLPKFSDWLVILTNQKDQRTQNWTFANTKNELKETLQESIGCYVKVVEDPLSLDDNIVLQGYEPDEDGQIRPGAY